MTPLVSVVVGPPSSGKTAQLVDRYRQVLRRAGRGGTVAGALWLAPTARSAAAVRQMLLADALDACLNPAVMTFDELADRALATAGRHLHRLSPCMQRALLAHVVEWAGEGKLLDTLRPSANRSGFVDLLADHIRELRRRGVRPEDYAATVAGTTRDRRDQQVELSLLYSEYERRLRSHSLCDQEGRHWAVRDLLATDDCPWLRKLELVVADGFADFTPVQHDVLRLLARRADHVIVSLPGDALPPPLPLVEDSPWRGEGRGEGALRRDLFAKSKAALDELRRYHPQLEVLRLPQRPGGCGWPALDHLSAHLFRNPRQVPSPTPAATESLSRVEVVGAAGAHDEIVQLARRIKSELVSGRARPGDLLVVFRSLGDVARRVREVFTEFGIPHALESGQPLLSAAIVRTLLSLLRLDLEDWPYRRVVSVVANNTLTALDDEARAAADWLVRELQIAEGRRTLFDRVQQLASLPLPLVEDPPWRREGRGEGASSHERRTAAAVAALPVLQKIALALDGLPQSASYTEWAEALARLATELGFSPPADDERSLPDGEVTTRNSAAAVDRVAWQRLAHHLASLGRLAGWLGEPARVVSRGEILRVLVDLATHESLPSPHDEVGRVRVLSATTARTIKAKHVYLAGMSEQAFPSPERIGRLATESDYRFFANAADQQRAETKPTPVDRSQEEMLLFYEVLTRATERLTISYPALDDKAQVLPPSPYVTEIERAFGPESIIRHVGPQLSPIPAEPTPLGLADRRVTAVHSALAGKRELLAGILADGASAPLAGAIDAGLRVVDARSKRHSFSPAEGLLTSDAVRDRLAQRFGPQHLWSPSQWEQYATCPYRFFLEHVLGLKPLGELSLETDFARRGSLLHRVLAAFHRHVRDVLGQQHVPSRWDEAQFQAEFKDAMATALAATPASGLDAALIELDRRQIEKWAGGYYSQHAKYDQAWPGLDRPPTPMHFEVRFGPPQTGEADDEDPRSTSLPFVLEVGDERIQIIGRIDRIDVGLAGGRAVFNVIDYKSGKKPSLKPDRIESGERLQLPLYVMAAQHLLFADDRAAPLSAGYWTMTGGFDARGSLKVSQCTADDVAPTDQWQALRPKVAQCVAEFVHAIRHGDFPVFSRDDNCTSRCEFSTVCRVAQIRSLGKTWPPVEKEGTSGEPLARG
jgi:ATP-dependent helicase/nuclease subunit B